MDSNCRSPVAKEVNPFREWEPSWSDKVRLEAVGYLPGTGSSNPSPSSAESVANLTFGAHSIGEPRVREVDEKAVGNIFDLAQGGDGAVQITGVPQDDRGDEEVQTRGAMLLIFIRAVANFPKSIDENGARQAVA